MMIGVGYFSLLSITAKGLEHSAKGEGYYYLQSDHSIAIAIALLIIIYYI